MAKEAVSRGTGGAGADDGLWPVARLELQVARAGFASEVFEALTDGGDPARPGQPETLEGIARRLKLPRGRFVEWFTTEHGERYEAALKVLGAGLGAAVKEMTDGVTPETLGMVKFQTDRYLRLAAHWNPERYARRVDAPVAGVPILTIVIRGEAQASGAPPAALHEQNAFDAAQASDAELVEDVSDDGII